MGLLSIFIIAQKLSELLLNSHKRMGI